MYWETETAYKLWQGKRLVGTVEELALRDGWRARYYPPLDASPKRDLFPNPSDAKTWLVAQLQAEMSGVEA